MRPGLARLAPATLLLLLGACGGARPTQSTSEPIEFEDEQAARLAPPASPEVTEAESLIAQGRAADAVPLLERAAAASAGDVRARLDLGLAHEMLEDLPAAERAYREAIAAQADFAEALNNLGALLRDTDRTEEGIAMLRRAVEARPAFASAHLNLALALEDTGDAAGAEAEYRIVMRLAPRDPASRTNLAMILIERGDREHALLELRQALPLAEGSRADLAQIGNGLRRAGDADLAVRALTEAIDAGEDPAPPALRAELVLAEYASGQREIAERHARDLAREAPGYPDIHWVLGNMLAAREVWSQAAEEYAAFIRMAPDAPEAAEARARLEYVRGRSRGR